MKTISYNLFENEMRYGTSRDSGRLISKGIFSLLNSYEVIEIDLKDAILTPSIADEVIGALAKKLGKPYFKQRIKIKNASAADIALLKHIIAVRISKD